MIDLKSLKVSGFRAFTREVAFEFENPVTLVFGANHLGESSTLNAIEWCLFGKDCMGTDTGIRELVHASPFSGLLKSHMICEKLIPYYERVVIEI